MFPIKKASENICHSHIVQSSGLNFNIAINSERVAHILVKIVDLSYTVFVLCYYQLLIM